MQYLLLIYQPEAEVNTWSEQEKGALFQKYMAFNQEQKNHLRGGNPLKPSSTATTVRVRGGKTLTTDGPFAETREQLAGYYLIEAPDLDAAMAIAAQIPSATFGSIEVRPVQAM